jgi:hypothetical protein
MNDGTNDIQPVGYQLKAGKGKHICEFQTNAGTADATYSLKFKQATTGSWTDVYIDDLTIGSREIARGSVVTDWVSYTPTLTLGSGSMTNSTVSGKWRRVGDHMEVTGDVTWSGAVGTWSDIRIAIPFGSIDTNKLNSNWAIVGISNAVDAGSAQTGSGTSMYFSTTTVRLRTQSGVSYDQATPYAFGSGDYIAWKFSVPIAGWSSNANISSEFGGRVIAMRAVRSGSGQAISSTSATDLIYNSVTDSLCGDTVTGMNISTGIYTVKESGWYKAQASGVFTGVTSGEIIDFNIVVNSTVVGTSQDGLASTTRVLIASTGDLLLSAGDTIKVTVDSVADSSYTFGNNAASYFTVEKIQSPQTLCGSEVVAAVCTTNAAQAVTNTSSDVINFEDVSFDTHGAVTTGASWKFTAPVAGIYSYVARVLTDSNTANGDSAAITLSVRKGGSAFSSSYVAKSGATATRFCGHVSGMVQLNAGQYIDVVLYNATGGTRTLYADGSYNRIEIKKVN